MNTESIRQPFWSVIYRETLQRKGLGRTLENLRFAQVRLQGEGMDLGAKSDKGVSYYRFLQQEAGTKIIYTDLKPKPEDRQVIQVDLEDHIPMADNTQDFLILSNVLEHLYHYQRALSECHRVLKPGAVLYGSVPFNKRVHPDPDDYFRYTASALTRMLHDAGFARAQVEPIGYGPLTAGLSHWDYLIPIRHLTFVAYFFAISLDRFLNWLIPHKKRERFTRNVDCRNHPLVYFFEAFKA